jgi:hypothetical protein
MNRLGSFAIVIGVMWAAPLWAQSSGPGTMQDFMGGGLLGSDSGTGSGTRSGGGTGAGAPLPPGPGREAVSGPTSVPKAEGQPSSPSRRQNNTDQSRASQTQMPKP